ncbi:hypothetical protein SPRG_20792 [Saprolegnia parasitica CBS 223.65]|uniref:Uncharacterized protein n=1 Tax=Saprolegnia parasitica (strain CBS 223.65) TaxID=695850 RepID=A0A067C394_SAPPC|nr:hypothetical protein SPRG_20792 [Saprolegnia parasitica CBS 223.65]KDO25214.1 hypothetical protein SPRG_20792 [Saprolegnia parasitica CBS 223.65]|eukprot:XP_012204119.1 hypothetical protein SPRG_20792 [Saprolegnia parasitica CBS 223.65]
MSNDDVWGLVQGRYDAAALERLLAGKSIASMEMDGWTPLHYACDNRSVTSLQPLLAAGASVHAVDETGYTPLHLLCKNSEINAKALGELIQAGALVDATSTDNKKSTPLHLLCMNENVSVALLQVVISAPGATFVNATDGDGNTALHYLASNHALQDDMFLLALRSVPRVGGVMTQNHFKATALHYLCQNAKVSPAMLHAMLHRPGVNPNTQDNIGNSPLHVLCENSRVTVALLREFMATDVPVTNTTLANTAGKRPFDALAAEDCIAYGQTFAPQHEAIPSASSTSGGEDTSELQGPLLAKVTAWNATLPPFDDAFYVAVSCEPAFEATYEQVQELSVALQSAMTTLTAWEAKMAEWRQCVVLAFVALVHPSMWATYAESFRRPLPLDVVKLRPAVEAIWQRAPTDRRERFGAIRELLR